MDIPVKKGKPNGYTNAGTPVYIGPENASNVPSSQYIGYNDRLFNPGLYKFNFHAPVEEGNLLYGPGLNDNGESGAPIWAGVLPYGFTRESNGVFSDSADLTPYLEGPFGRNMFNAPDRGIGRYDYDPMSGAWLHAMNGPFENEIRADDEKIYPSMNEAERNEYRDKKAFDTNMALDSMLGFGIEEASKAVGRPRLYTEGFTDVDNPTKFLNSLVDMEARKRKDQQESGPIGVSEWAKDLPNDANEEQRRTAAQEAVKEEHPNLARAAAIQNALDNVADPFAQSAVSMSDLANERIRESLIQSLLNVASPTPQDAGISAESSAEEVMQANLLDALANIANIGSSGTSLVTTPYRKEIKRPSKNVRKK